MSQLANHANFATIVTRSLEGVEHLTEEFLSQLLRSLKLPVEQETALVLGLTRSVEPQSAKNAVQYLKTRTAEISSKNLPESLLHQLLAFYETHEGFEGPKASLVKTLNPSTLNLVQAPLLEDAQPIVNSRRRFEDRTENILVAQLISSCQLAALIQDIGVAALSSKAAFTEILSEFPTIQEVDVAQVLGVLAKTGAQPDADAVLQVFQGTHRDPPPGQQGWNTVVFVDVLKSMVASFLTPSIPSSTG